MIGVWILLATGTAYELWAELGHHETITAGVRSLPLPGRLVLCLLLAVLALHFVTTPEWAARHDPVDQIEHDLHSQVDQLKGGTNP